MFVCRLGFVVLPRAPSVAIVSRSLGSQRCEPWANARLDDGNAQGPSPAKRRSTPRVSEVMVELEGEKFRMQTRVRPLTLECSVGSLNAIVKWRVKCVSRGDLKLRSRQQEASPSRPVFSMPAPACQQLDGDRSLTCARPSIGRLVSARDLCSRRKSAAVVHGLYGAGQSTKRGLLLGCKS